MKIVIINGSHRGRGYNTDAMAQAFLAGAKEAGAATEYILLAEKKLHHCTACKACWFHTPGQCALPDDMPSLLAQMSGSDLRVLATPIYSDHMSSMLKTFLDRLMVLASPHWDRDEKGESRHRTLAPSPRLLMMANCGYPQRSHFAPLSHWFHRYARNLNAQIAGEIYTPQGALLTSPDPAIRTLVTPYLASLEKAGREIAACLRLTPETETALAQSFLPEETYIQGVEEYIRALEK